MSRNELMNKCPDTRVMVQEMAEMVVECPNESPEYVHWVGWAHHNERCPDCKGEGTVPLIPELQGIDFDYDDSFITKWALIQAALRMGWEVVISPSGLINLKKGIYSCAETRWDTDTNLICAMYEAVTANVRP